MNSIAIHKSWVILTVVCLFAIYGCKNQQKIAAEQATEIQAENIAKSKEILLSILNDDGQMSLAEKEKKLRQARALNSDDPEVQQLIAQVEDLLQSERESLQATEEAVTVDPSLEQQLDELFSGIARSQSAASANRLIDNGLTMFSAPDTPVLIIISQSGNVFDYDQPTTIERYLNYLKDRKASPNEIYQVKKDNAGKISELELIKKSIR